MRRSFVIALSLALLVGTAARAAEATDPKDTPSRLDISFIRVNAERNGMGTVRLETHGRWRSRYLGASKETSVAFRFDDGNDGEPDVAGNFRYRNGRLVFVLTDFGNNSQVRDVVAAHHPDRHTLWARFSFDRGEFRSEHLSAVGKTYDQYECGDPSTFCLDRAPDGRHSWLPVY